MSRHAKCLAACGVQLLVFLLLAGPLVAPATASGTVDYSPPVDAVVVDPFRAPAGPYGAGNRGLDYQASPGQEVRAAGDGEVVFVGPIAGSTHVVVLHGDGIRTSYSFLASASVTRGQKVARGQVLGRARGEVHFGARAGEAYLDPADLFGGRTPAVRLVPLEPLSAAGERKGLLTFLGAGVRQALDLAGHTGSIVFDGVVALGGGEFARLVVELWATVGPGGVIRYGVAGYRGVAAALRPCTAGGADPPPAERGVVVRVSGLGSSSEAIRNGGGIGAVDPHEIGMPGARVYSFAYGDPERSVEEGGTYSPADTLGGFEESGAQLATLLSRVRAENPGRPIVIVAHSQGGLIAREALGHTGTAGIAGLVTLATPHHGSDLATAGARLRHTVGGQVVAGAVEAASGVDISASSVSQLAETSDFVDSQGPLPEGLKLTTIVKAGDLAVPVARSSVAGADNRVIPSTSLLGDHFDITDDPAAHREIRLALAGQDPACRPFGSVVGDHFRSELTSHGIDLLGVAASLPLGPAVPGIT